MKKLAWFTAVTAAAGAYGVLRASRQAAKLRMQQAVPATAPRVVVLGGGFAGMTAVKTLAERLGGRAQILLIDRHNYHLFTPMLYEAATCAVAPSDIAYPLRQCTGPHGADFRRATIRGVDFKQRRVLLGDGEVPFDYLVIALGSTASFFGNEAARQHTLALKQLEDGIVIRNRVVDMLEQASTMADPALRTPILTFVVVGGGATGVETAGALADLLQRVMPREYPHLDPRATRVVVVEAAPKLLGHMSSRMADVALRDLRKMGVDVRLNTGATNVTPGQVTLSNGETISAQTIIWAAGVQPPEIIAKLDAPHGPEGSLAVDEYLQVRGYPKVYAIGDSAHVEDGRTHNPVPLLAAAAEQEGRAVGRNIARDIAGRRQFPFRYRDLGNVVSLGHRSGVALIGGVLIEGFAGWLAWRLVHLARITSFRSKLAAALDWTVDYLYDEDTVRLEVEPSYRAEDAA
jgi:NADH dehydrogenase